MLNANANSHYKTLKGWTKSAEHSRNQLLQQLSDAEGGVYKVKMDQTDSWELMHRPPSTGASEWLYLNANGIPIYYWSKDQSGLTII